MSEPVLQAYSDLLLDYCLQVISGQKLFIQSTTLAEPLVARLYAGALQRNAIVEVNLSFDKQEELFNQFAHEAVARWVNPTYALAMQSFDAYLYIRAPFETSANAPMAKNMSEIRRDALRPFQKMYSERTGSKAMRRSLCQYPTLASAKDAEMTLEEYNEFVTNACFLNFSDPVSEWKRLSQNQKHWVDLLNQSGSIRYKNRNTDISFSVEGRNWINSDGQTNMPSGEIYTSPVEDSLQGFIYFDYPVLYQQRLMQGIRLEVESGFIKSARADQGQMVLDEIMAIPGARFFGEVAIGTNTYIQQATKNILFDEKIAGTVHMAIGQSYEQCGGKNESSVHLDLIADMKQDGEIFADGRLIYKNGAFIL
jgi:aminopeptidase